MYTFLPIYFDPYGHIPAWHIGWVQKAGHPKYLITPMMEPELAYHYHVIECRYGPLPVTVKEFIEIMRGNGTLDT